MITNLFRIFDPRTNWFSISLNWIRRLFVLFILPFSFWLQNNSYFVVFAEVKSFLFQEFVIIVKNKFSNIIIFMYSIFVFLLFNNFLGLFPYIFTSTSHLVLNMTIAFPSWFCIIFYGWLKKTNHMFIHLVPLGTPLILIIFIVLIETIRLIIRPVTLIIRLTANIIAGHLLLTLLGNLGTFLTVVYLPFLLLLQIILLTLESAVAIIQAYVFSILLILYYQEIYKTKQSLFSFNW